MAIMIPSKETEVDFNHSMGEMHLSEMLRQLPDNYYIFHSARWNRRSPSERNPKQSYVEWREADFLIYLPQRGLISLEVKDGDIRFSQAEGWQQINRANGVSKFIDPMYQAQRSMFYFKDLLSQKLPEIFCPVCAAVWFTSADRKAMAGEYPNNYQKELVLWANDMANPTQVQHVLTGVFDFFNIQKREVDEETIRAVVNVLSPEFGVFESMRTLRMVSETLFYRMTQEQSKLLDYLEEQETAAIQGCAGTGKTMLAIQKAQRLAENAPVLFLCFNKFLKEHLQEQYQQPNLSINNLESLYCHKTHNRQQFDKEDEAGKTHLIEEFLYSWDDYGMNYKHIIIDEGQDFDNLHLELLQMIAANNHGCFYVFYDKHQAVRGKPLPSCINKMECRLVLNRNCRNTHQIALTSTRPVGIEESKIKMRLDIADESNRHLKPNICILENKEELLSELDARISSYVHDSIPKSQIVVLTLKTMETSLIQPEDYRLSSANALSAERSEGKILFTTVRKFKGLESDAVICVDMDETGFNTEQKRNEFYVGTSRAKLCLTILPVLPTDEKLIALANSISNAPVNSALKARINISCALKVKLDKKMASSDEPSEEKS